MFRVISLDVSSDPSGEEKKQEDKELGVDSLLDKFFEPTVLDAAAQ